MALFIAASLASVAFASAAPPKVILHITLDDLGWHNVDWHRNASDPERVTPNMAALAKNGVILDQLYGYRMCTPSRTSFLSGRFPVHVNEVLGNPEDSNTGVPYNMTCIGTQMKLGGYKTHAVGKWDAGMATPRHTPEGRGFDSSLIYFNHKNDYWVQTVDQGQCMNYDNDQIVDLWDSGAPARSLNGTAYEEFIFRDRMLDIIATHDPTTGPLFIYWAPHIVHCPLQVPRDWLDLHRLPDDEPLCQAQTPYIFPGSNTSDYACRSQHTAMLALWDTILGNVTAALEAKGWMPETLITLHSDNGGAIDLPENAANNYPLRGGKYSDFSGGVLVTGFVGGGYVPPSVRGTTTNASMHVADWLATYSGLAGITPTDPLAAAAGLPGYDSLDLWPFLSGSNSTPPRYEIPVSSFSLVQGHWKYIDHKIIDGGYQGPVFPNASSPNSQPANDGLNCAAGCLFNLADDPFETTDQSKANPAILKRMSARLAALSQGFYQNHDDFGNGSCNSSLPAGMPCACYLAMPGNTYNGFLGPWALLP